MSGGEKQIVVSAFYFYSSSLLDYDYDDFFVALLWREVGGGGVGKGLN